MQPLNLDFLGTSGLNNTSYGQGYSTPGTQSLADMLRFQPGQVNSGAPQQGSFLGGMLDQTDANGNVQQGWGGLALDGAQALGGAYMGYKQLQIAKNSLRESRRQFNLNFGAQQQTTNAAIEDRQRARVAANPGAYESVGSYMNKNRI